MFSMKIWSSTLLRQNSRIFRVVMPVAWAVRCCPRAGPGIPTFEFAGTGRSFLKSRAGRGSGRPNVTGSSPQTPSLSRYLIQSYLQTNEMIHSLSLSNSRATRRSRTRMGQKGQTRSGGRRNPLRPPSSPTSLSTWSLSPTGRTQLSGTGRMRRWRSWVRTRLRAGSRAGLIVPLKILGNNRKS